MAEHRWSGWPGAWCLDCGFDDQRESCIAGCPEFDAFLQIDMWEDGSVGHAGFPFQCSVHKNNPCKEPGSNRCNPYSYYDTTAEDDGLGR